MAEPKILDYGVLFNPEVKGEFLEEIRKTKARATYIAFYRHLIRLSDYEKNILKEENIYDLGYEGCVNLLKNLWIESPSTGSSLRTVCSQYVDFALLVKGLGMGNINHFRSIKSKQIKQMVKKSTINKKYITPNEYFAILTQIEHFSDKAIVALIWEKLMDKKLKSILNIKKQDINTEENTIVIESTGEVIEVTPETMTIIELVFEENDYNGYPLVTTDYLIRPTVAKGHRKYQEKCTYNLINQRMWKLFKNLELEAVTLKSIYHSRVAYELLEKEKELGEEMRYTQLKNELDLYGLGSQTYTIKDAMAVIRKKLEEENNSEKEKKIRDKIAISQED